MSKAKALATICNKKKFFFYSFLTFSSSLKVRKVVASPNSKVQGGMMSTGVPSDHDAGSGSDSGGDGPHLNRKQN